MNQVFVMHLAKTTKKSNEKNEKKNYMNYQRKLIENKLALEVRDIKKNVDDFNKQISQLIANHFRCLHSK